MIPIWFVYIGGFSLIILGALQIQARPYQRGDSFFKRFINIGTFWSLFCISAGVVIVLYGLGYVGGAQKLEAPTLNDRPVRLRPGR